jgi:hypothetical protein
VIKDPVNVAIVTSIKALIAAIRAAAHPTYAEAVKNPVTIRFRTTTYTFNKGIHEKQAEQLATQIARNTRYSRAS